MQPEFSTTAFQPHAGASVPCVNGGIPCYLPGEIQAAYNYPVGRGAATGAGQTIVVVTAYGSPFFTEDLNTFAAVTSVPYPPNVVVVNQKTAIPAAQGTG